MGCSRKKNMNYLTYYPNGQIEFEVELDKDSIMNGKAIKYYPDGKIQEIRFYSNDKLNGEFKTYYRNGKLKERNIYYDDIPNGIYETYDSIFGLNKIGKMKDGKAEGKFVYYEDSIRVRRKIKNYFQGNANGEFIVYDDNNKIKEYYFVQDNEVVLGVKYFPDSMLMTQIDTNKYLPVYFIKSDFNKLPEGKFIVLIYYYNPPKTKVEIQIEIDSTIIKFDKGENPIKHVFGVNGKDLIWNLKYTFFDSITMSESSTYTTYIN
jgi:antitoxin component YwqK of YwqJK toxin-antitoxin module